MLQFCHEYGRPCLLINGFRMPAGFRNSVTGEFRNPATLVNGLSDSATAYSRTLP